MKFTPKTEEQLNLENLTEPGTYDFEVQFAHDKRKDGGSESIHLKIKVYESANGGPIVDCYLTEKMGFLLRHFCEETGLMHKYDSGTLCAQDCVGKAGKLQLDIEPAKNGFRARNRVKDFGAKKDPKASTGNERRQEAAPGVLAKPEDDSSVPF